jgi:hypothetical protein
LRAATLALTAGTSGQAGLVRQRDEKARLLKRIDLQRELVASGVGPTPTLLRTEMAAARRHATSLRAALADLERPGAALPPLAMDAENASRALKFLLSGCLPCHRLNADLSGFMKVRAGLPLMTAARFSHQPHVGQATCESCHAAVESTATNDDTLLPGVASCQTCHRSGRARDDCASCHTFHERPIVTRAGRTP